jgi:hypothetical protein
MVPTGPTSHNGARGRTLVRADGSVAPITFASFPDATTVDCRLAKAEPSRTSKDCDAFVKAIRPGGAKGSEGSEVTGRPPENPGGPSV